MYNIIAETWEKAVAVCLPAASYYAGRILFAWITTGRIKRYVRRLLFVVSIGAALCLLPQILLWGENAGLWNGYSMYFQPYFIAAKEKLSFLNFLPALLYGR